MARKGENIYKRKDNRWEARVAAGYTPDGKRKYHSIYGKTYKEAKDKKKDYLLTHTFEEKKSYEFYLAAVPFEICIKEWLERQKDQVKSSTYSTYVRIAEAQLLPELGPLLLNRINQTIIKDFLVKKEKNGRCDGKGGLSSKTISDIIVILNSIFDYACKQYQYPNPIKDLKRTFRAKNNMEPLNESECKLLTHYLVSNIGPESAGVLSSLYMGLRLGEVCALKWENIDLDNCVFKIRHTLYRILSDEYSKKTELALSSPKTESSVRDVPIPQFMLPFLEALACEPECYLLTGHTSCIEPRTYQNHFKKVLKDCGMRNIPYHCLRHTFATNCVILDFDVKTLSEILGHANTTITLDRYVHSSLHQKQKQMIKISNSVSSIL